MSDERTITISGTAAIPDTRPLQIRLKKGHGFTVLRGENGEGKSDAIAAVQSLISGEGPLELNRQSEKGIVEGLGARVTIGKTTRHTGDLVCRRLEGVNPMAIVDPGIKDPAAADLSRIRNLARLVQAKLIHGQFGELVGGMDVLREYVSEATLAETDATSMAGAFKRDFEKVARALAEQSGTLKVRAEGLRQSTEAYDLTAECDEQLLSDATENAVRALAHSEGKRSAANERRSGIAEAQQALDAAARGEGGLTVEEAEAAVRAAETASVERIELASRLHADAIAARDSAEGKKNAQSAKVSELREQLAREESELSRLRQEHAALNTATESAGDEIEAARQAGARTIEAERRTVERARKAQDSLAVLRAQVAKGAGDAGPSDDQLAELRRSVESAKKRQEMGAGVRDAKRRSTQADSAALEAAEIELRSLKFREAAANCEELLAHEIQKLAPAGMKIRGGRLKAKNKHGEEEFFDKLSIGERTRLILPLAIKAVGENGIMTMPQTQFEGLDPVNRDAVEEILIEHEVDVVTAQAARGELRAEPYESDRAETAA